MAQYTRKGTDECIWEQLLPNTHSLPSAPITWRKHDPRFRGSSTGTNVHQGVEWHVSVSPPPVRRNYLLGPKGSKQASNTHTHTHRTNSTASSSSLCVLLQLWKAFTSNHCTFSYDAALWRSEDCTNSGSGMHWKARTKRENSDRYWGHPRRGTTLTCFRNCSQLTLPEMQSRNGNDRRTMPADHSLLVTAGSWGSRARHGHSTEDTLPRGTAIAPTAAHTCLRS